MITLTVQEIKELAEFTGLLSVSGDLSEDEAGTRIVVAECPPDGVRNDGEPSDPVSVSHYEFIAYCEDCPEEGCIGLGPEITPPPASQSAPSAGSGELPVDVDGALRILDHWATGSAIPDYQRVHAADIAILIRSLATDGQGVE